MNAKKQKKVESFWANKKWNVLIVLACAFFVKELIPAYNDIVEFGSNIRSAIYKEEKMDIEQFIENDLFSKFGPGINSALLEDILGKPLYVWNYETKEQYLQWNTKKYYIGALIEKDSKTINTLLVSSPMCLGKVKIERIQAVLCESKYPDVTLTENMHLLGGYKYGGYFESLSYGGWNEYMKQYLGRSSWGEEQNSITDYIYTNDLIHFPPEDLSLESLVKVAEFKIARDSSIFNYYAIGNDDTEINAIEMMYVAMEKPNEVKMFNGLTAD